MSYTKLEVHYTTDGINTLKSVNTRTGEKVKTLSLPNKVTEYGDKHGYSSIEITYHLDHVILKGGGEVLMDKDINKTYNNEYIRSIVSTKWIK